jgi:hypothetical protein
LQRAWTAQAAGCAADRALAVYLTAKKAKKQKGEKSKKMAAGLSAALSRI